MRKYLLILLILISMSSIAETAWEHYIINPSAESAEKVNEVKYNRDLSGFERSRAVYSDLAKLQEMVINGEHHAYKVALKLHNQSSLEHI